MWSLTPKHGSLAAKVQLSTAVPDVVAGALGRRCGHEHRSELAALLETEQVRGLSLFFPCLLPTRLPIPLSFLAFTQQCSALDADRMLEDISRGQWGAVGLWGAVGRASMRG